MEAALWYVLTGTRGGPNRARILWTLRQRPRNANQLAETLDLHYETVRHHLDVLQDNDVVTRGGEGYGAVYLPSERVRQQWDVVESILGEVDIEPERDEQAGTDTGVDTDP
ncbi:ArsR/SmtB family transcription factor [Halomarina ordinaria]|uniref:ArsR/SmtB family transcription factor n=1 Tax=Halomarina ordinaria TaxID=3033939 RepID=A0ABD5U4U2_9EURY|nr:winged helix-turn-helix domain-containing protein [Halomarina sp. PSRA2]